MKAYRDYMERQQVSGDLHSRILALEQQTSQQPAPKKKSNHWGKIAALAACLCVVVALGQFVRYVGLGAASDSAAGATVENAECMEEPAAAAEESEDTAAAAVTTEDSKADFSSETPEPTEEVQEEPEFEEAAAEETPAEETAGEKGTLSVPYYEDWTEYEGDDPNWPLTHFQTADLSEMEAICGTDLLLDKIALPGEYHSEYILEMTEEGDFADPQLWSNLTIEISYGDSVIDAAADNIFCFLSFDGDIGAINAPLWESDTTMEMNGCMIQYSEKTSADYAADGITPASPLEYHGYAVFTRNGYTYYLGTNSDDADFFENVLGQMIA